MIKTCGNIPWNIDKIYWKASLVGSHRIGLIKIWVEEKRKRKLLKRQYGSDNSECMETKK